MIGPWEDEACLQELQAQVTSLHQAGATECLQQSALLSCSAGPLHSHTCLLAAACSWAVERRLVAGHTA